MKLGENHLNCTIIDQREGGAGMQCSWCKEQMDPEAIVCPHCQRERKDFYTLKYLMYSMMAITTLAIIYGIIVGDWVSPFLGEFQVERLFTTLSGWTAIISFVASQALYAMASLKIKSWWWV